MTTNTCIKIYANCAWAANENKNKRNYKKRLNLTNELKNPQRK